MSGRAPCTGAGRSNACSRWRRSRRTSTTPDRSIANIAWLHRRVKSDAPAQAGGAGAARPAPDAGDTDIYYVANLTDRPQAFDARFRVAGRQVEIWHPDTGRIEPAGYAIAGGQTTVPLRLDERQLVFVVFRRPAAAPARTIARGDLTTLATIDGAWDVAFPANLGAPPQCEFPELQPWSAHADEGVKYFSGTATYTKTIQASRDWFTPDHAVFLDLGRVGDIAEVSVNGRALGQLWKAPYRVDVSAVLRPGDNQIEIKVTNQWTNRIAGDRLLAADKKILAPPPPGRGGAGAPAPPLPESGLIGPVTIRSQPLNRVADGPDGSVADIPANYTEARTGRYTLPDPLKLADGRPVRDAQTWLKRRRPELVRLFEENQYGRAPGRPADMSFDVFDKGTPAFDGKATRRQVTIYFTEGQDRPEAGPAAVRAGRRRRTRARAAQHRLHGQQPRGERPGREGRRRLGSQAEAARAGDGRAPFRVAGRRRDHRARLRHRHVQLRRRRSGRARRRGAGHPRRVPQAGPGRAGAGRVGGHRGVGVGHQPGGGLPGDRPCRGREADRDHRRVAAGQDRDVGRRRRSADRGGHRELLGRRRRGAEPPQLRRDHRAPGRADALPVPVRRRTTRSWPPIPARRQSTRTCSSRSSRRGRCSCRRATPTPGPTRRASSSPRLPRGRCSSCSASAGRRPTRSRPRGRSSATRSRTTCTTAATAWCRATGRCTWTSSRSSSDPRADFRASTHVDPAPFGR